MPAAGTRGQPPLGRYRDSHPQKGFGAFGRAQCASVHLVHFFSQKDFGGKGPMTHRYPHPDYSVLCGVLKISLLLDNRRLGAVRWMRQV